jgi:hypothetical protein
MRKRIVTTAALALFLAGVACLPWAAAQEPAKQTEAQPIPTDSYKVEFTVNELDDGKKINSRSYSMQMGAAVPLHWTNLRQVRVGSRVPVAVEAGKFQYEDVGMSIDCRLMPLGTGEVSIDTNWKYSSLGDEQDPKHDPQHPVVREVRSDVEAVVPLDKPTVISEMDDVASTHRFVFEVKVTKNTP